MMHVDDLPDDIPQERFVWVTTTNRYLVNLDELQELSRAKSADGPNLGFSFTDMLTKLAYEVEQISSRGGQPIVICPSGHVIADGDGECGWCEAAWEAAQEARYDR